MKFSENDINLETDLKSEKNNPTIKEMVIIFLLSLYVVMALTFKLDTIIALSSNAKLSIDAFRSAFNMNNIQQIFLLLFSYSIISNSVRLIQHKSFHGFIEWSCHIFPAALFSLFVILGFLFSGDPGKPLILTANRYQIAMFIFVFSGYFVIFLSLIILLFAWINQFPWTDSFGISCSYIQRIEENFEKNPFTVTFLALLIGYIPNLILSYPAIFTVDSVNQILQGYDFIPLKNHHPVLHTMLLHYFIELGKTVYSYNFGVFLYTLFQSLFFIAAVSYSTRLLVVYCKIRLRTFFPVILYFIIHLMIQIYSVTLSKDSIYTSIFLFYFSLSFIYLKEGKLSRNQFILWLLSIAGILLFRNEGIYLVVPMLFFWMLLYKPRRKIGLVMLLTVMFFISWNRVILPFLSIEKGSLREMLSIPFQQTARYVKYLPDKVTKNEKKVIDTVLNYDTLAKRYDPNWASPVKNGFNEKSTQQERRDYLKIWLSMFIKEPKLYLEAVLANKFAYFYSGQYHAFIRGYEGSRRSMDKLNVKYKNISWKFHHPKSLNKSRALYEKIRKSVFSLPVLNILICSFTYVWIAILLIFYTIKTRTLSSFLLIVPMVLQLLVLIAGPRNGDQFRYVYPISIWFPFLFFYVLTLKKYNNII